VKGLLASGGKGFRMERGETGNKKRPRRKKRRVPVDMERNTRGAVGLEGKVASMSAG